MSDKLTIGYLFQNLKLLILDLWVSFFISCFHKFTVGLANSLKEVYVLLYSADLITIDAKLDSCI